MQSHCVGAAWHVPRVRRRLACWRSEGGPGEGVVTGVAQMPDSVKEAGTHCRV